MSFDNPCEFQGWSQVFHGKMQDRKPSSKYTRKFVWQFRNLHTQKKISLNQLNLFQKLFLWIFIRIKLHIVRKSLKAHQDSKFSFLTNFTVTVNNGKQNVLSLPETDERRASQLDETGEPTFIKQYPHKNTFLGKFLVKKSSWSEHTWSTFISRAEEETEPEPLGAQLLSQFQKDKFVHFFYFWLHDQIQL